MASRLGLVGCFIVIVALVLKGSSAATYTVGDGLTWTIPPGGEIAYRTWARSKSFNIGDVIVFNWTGTHDVAEVTKENYDSCTDTAIGSIQNTSPVNFNLTSNATRYFICTISSHCEIGQKVTIGIGSDFWNSASSLKYGALSAVLSTIAISFLTFF
ncbi:stellacyanin-like [Castanea sativa]|uniref:stellacyanin-like n=1 Tax=Castanea sativa TaxID=21020 RepID=UPI003F64F885